MVDPLDGDGSSPIKKQQKLERSNDNPQPDTQPNNEEGVDSSWLKSKRGSKEIKEDTINSVQTILDSLCCAESSKASALQILKKELEANLMRDALLFGLLDLQLQHSRAGGKSKSSIENGYSHFIKLVGEAWKKAGYELVNTGNGLSPKTKGLVAKNYAPSTDCKENNPDTQDRIPDKNGCIFGLRHVATDSIAREVGGEASDEDYEAIAIIDAITIALEKDRYLGRFAKAYKKLQIKKAEAYLIPIILLGYHALFYQACHGDSSTLSVIIASANARDNMFDSSIIKNLTEPLITRLLRINKYILHGENIVNAKYLLKYGVNELRGFGYWHANFLQGVIHVDLSSLINDGPLESSVFYLKLSGLLFMSDEEKAALEVARSTVRVKIAEAWQKVKTSIAKAFNGEALSEEEFSQYKNKYRYIMEAAAAASKLNTDESIAPDVVDEINAILSKGRDEEDVSTSALRDRWISFLDWCEKAGQGRLHQILSEAAKEYIFAREMVKTSISRAFQGDFEEDFWEEENLDQYCGRFRHVVEAAAASQKLKEVGSNTRGVFDEINGIFSKGGVPVKTVNTRWESFLNRCENLDPELYASLEREWELEKADHSRVRINQQRQSTLPRRNKFALLAASNIGR